MELEKKFVVKAKETEEQASPFSHPWNPNSEVHATRLSSQVGLSRLGISWVRVPAGKESFVYHSHYREEEWIYILSLDFGVFMSETKRRWVCESRLTVRLYLGRVRAQMLHRNGIGELGK